jgi:hypothetical protein
LNFSPIHSGSQRKNPSEISIPIRLEPNQTPQNDPKKNLQYPFRFSTENLHKTTQIKTKIKKSSLKIILTQKKMDFLLFWHRENAGTPTFLASPALGREPPEPAPLSAPNGG